MGRNLLQKSGNKTDPRSVGRERRTGGRGSAGKGRDRVSGKSNNLVNQFVCSSIRRLRLERGLRIQEIAQRSGIPLGSYSCLETGRYRMSLENLFRILQVLGADVREVWPDSSPETTQAVDEEFIRGKIREAEARWPPRLTLDDVLAAACRACGVDIDAVASPSRRRNLAEARTLAALMTRDIGHLSLVALSRRLGRDVSSLSHCLRRYSERLESDPKARRMLALAERNLRDRQREIRAVS